MNVLPRLIKKRVLIAFGHVVKEGNQVQDGMEEVEVEVWESRGLCIHRRRDVIEMGEWRITHVNSGRTILRYLNNRKEAIVYLMILYRWRSVEGWEIDWNKTEVQLKAMYFWEELVGMMNELQKQISGEVR